MLPFVVSSSEYRCLRTPSPIVIDGDLTKEPWRRAKRSPRFGDMVTGDPGFFDTRAAALWDDQNLYIAFWIEEPFVEAALTERDSLIFNENDVELFIDGGDCYYEFEINALGTIYEVSSSGRTPLKRPTRFNAPQFDIRTRQAVTFGGDYDRQPKTFWRGTHPRGLRWAFLDWDFPGLRSAVQVDGKINDRSSSIAAGPSNSRSLGPACKLSRMAAPFRPMKAIFGNCFSADLKNCWSTALR